MHNKMVMDLETVKWSSVREIGAPGESASILKKAEEHYQEIAADRSKWLKANGKDEEDFDFEKWLEEAKQVLTRMHSHYRQDEKEPTMVAKLKRQLAAERLAFYDAQRRKEKGDRMRSHANLVIDGKSGCSGRDECSECFHFYELKRLRELEPNYKCDCCDC